MIWQITAEGRFLGLDRGDWVTLVSGVALSSSLLCEGKE
jgi:hypothetical protein